MSHDEADAVLALEMLVEGMKKETARANRDLLRLRREQLIMNVCKLEDKQIDMFQRMYVQEGSLRDCVYALTQHQLTTATRQVNEALENNRRKQENSND